MRLHGFPGGGKKSPEGWAEDLEMKADEETGTLGALLALPFFIFVVQFPHFTPTPDHSPSP